jgi:hypothetical protein
MKCPKCNAEGTVVMVGDALIMDKGPEGPLHAMGCMKCGWNRPASSIVVKHIVNVVPLKSFMEVVK